MVVTSIPFLIFIIVTIIENKSIPIDSLNADQWVNVFGGLIGYFGTCLLGALALFQSDKQNIENKEAQKRLEEANERAEKINDRLLKIEELKYIPIIDIVTAVLHHSDEVDKDKARQSFTFGSNNLDKKYDIMFDCKNVGEAYINKIEIENIKIIKDNELVIDNWRKSFGSSHINVGAQKMIIFEHMIDEVTDISEMTINFNLYNLLGKVYEQQVKIDLGKVNIRDTKTIMFTIEDKIIGIPIIKT